MQSILLPIATATATAAATATATATAARAAPIPATPTPATTAADPFHCGEGSCYCCWRYDAYCYDDDDGEEDEDDHDDFRDRRCCDALLPNQTMPQLSTIDVSTPTSLVRLRVAASLVAAAKV